MEEMHTKLWLETFKKKTQLNSHLEQNTVEFGDFLTRVVIPQTGEFLESPKEGSKHTAIEGCMHNQQLLSGQPKLQLGHEL
jgi:hypothetical protein